MLWWIIGASAHNVLSNSYDFSTVAGPILTVWKPCVQVVRGAACDLLQALATKKATVTPLWVAFWVMLKYRTRNNYCSPMYLFGRLFDKTIFTFLVATFYLWVGRADTAANEPNIAGLLFMWCVLASTCRACLACKICTCQQSEPARKSLSFGTSVQI